MSPASRSGHRRLRAATGCVLLAWLASGLAAAAEVRPPGLAVDAAPAGADVPSQASAAAEAGAPDADGRTATTMEAIRVTAPRPRVEDLYRSRPPPRTPPTVFDRAWREPVNLKKIGDNGGVLPLLIDYVAGKIARGARKTPGWSGPVQAAAARPPPLDEAQAARALRLQQDAAAAGDDRALSPPP